MLGPLTCQVRPILRKTLRQWKSRMDRSSTGLFCWRRLVPCGASFQCRQHGRQNRPPRRWAMPIGCFQRSRRVLADRGEKAAAKTPLVSGPVIQESVYEGAKVKLGGSIDGKFALTLWRFSSRRPVPGIAEISFKCETQSGFMPASAAWRAFALFVGLQDELGDLVDVSHSSKTALALPARCGR